MNSAGSSKASASKQTSLFVGSLQPNVTEAKLLELFSKFGAVCSVRICRDKVTKRFLGYAYVTFRRVEDATQALEAMKERVICGRPIRVLWAERNAMQPVGQTAGPTKEKKPFRRSANDSQTNPVGIFINGLNPAIRDANLRGLFSSSGNIVDCGVGLDDGGCSKGFGFVQFESEEAVESCLEKVKSWLLTGSTLSVTKLYSNVHLYNFGYRLNFGSLHKLFEPFGTIIDYRVVKKYGKSNGFGYVTFEKLKSAAHAIAELNGKDLGDDLKLKVVSAPRPSSDGEGPIKHDEGVNLYIKIKDTSVTDERLQELFSPFGPIISVKVFTGPENSTDRTGFVRFASNEDALKAIAEMNGKVVGNGPLSVSLAHVKKEKPKATPKIAPKSNISERLNSVPAREQALEEKRALAERLYLVVKQLNVSMAGSITVRLLELDNLQHLMQHAVKLKSKVDEIVVTMLLSREQHLKRLESAPAGSAAA